MGTYQDTHLELEFESRQVKLDAESMVLTRKEFDLLSLLVENAGEIVPRALLLKQVWGYSTDIRTRTLDVHIGRLRAKIEEDTRHPRYIVTVPGIGYKLCVPEDASAAA